MVFVFVDVAVAVFVVAVLFIYLIRYSDRPDLLKVKIFSEKNVAITIVDNCMQLILRCITSF